MISLRLALLFAQRAANIFSERVDDTIRWFTKKQRKCVSQLNNCDFLYTKRASCQSDNIFLSDGKCVDSIQTWHSEQTTPFWYEEKQFEELKKKIIECLTQTLPCPTTNPRTLSGEVKGCFSSNSSGLNLRPASAASVSCLKYSSCSRFNSWTSS